MVNRGRIVSHAPLTPRTKGFVDRHLQFIEQFGYSALDIADIAAACQYDEDRVTQEMLDLVEKCLDGRAEEAWQPSQRVQAPKPKTRSRQKNFKPKKTDDQKSIPTVAEDHNLEGQSGFRDSKPRHKNSDDNTESLAVKQRPSRAKNSSRSEPKSGDIPPPDQRSDNKINGSSKKPAGPRGRTYADVIKGQELKFPPPQEEMQPETLPNPKISDDIKEEQTRPSEVTLEPRNDEGSALRVSAQSKRTWLNAARGVKPPTIDKPSEAPANAAPANAAPAVAAPVVAAPGVAALGIAAPAVAAPGIAAPAEIKAEASSKVEEVPPPVQRRPPKYEGAETYTKRPPTQKSSVVHTILKQPVSNATSEIGHIPSRNQQPRRQQRARQPIIHTGSHLAQHHEVAHVPDNLHQESHGYYQQTSSGCQPAGDVASYRAPPMQYAARNEGGMGGYLNGVDYVMPSVAPLGTQPDLGRFRENVETPLRPPPGMYMPQVPSDYTARMTPHLQYAAPQMFDPYYYDPRKHQYVDQYGFMDRRSGHPMMMYPPQNMYQQDFSGYLRRPEGESSYQHPRETDVPTIQRGECTGPEYIRAPPQGMPPMFASAAGRAEISAVTDETYSMMGAQGYGRQYAYNPSQHQNPDSWRK